MALWGTGEVKAIPTFTVLYSSSIFNYTRGMEGFIREGTLNTGATIPDPADVKKDVSYTDIYRVPLTGTFEGGAPAKISDRG